MKRRCFIVGAGAFDGFLTAETIRMDEDRRKEAARSSEKTMTVPQESNLALSRETTAVPQEGDLVIAADGGYRYLKELGIEPDVLMGDFDSLEIVPEHRHLIRHSPIKDDTDMALAAAYGEEAGCRTFFLYGGLGGRLDHTLANLQLLAGMARRGLEAYLIGQGSVLTAISNGYLEFSGRESGMISVFCMGEKALGVREYGLKYSPKEGMFTCDRALGVSNEFTGVKSGIEVENGTLLVMWNAENGLPVQHETHPV